MLRSNSKREDRLFTKANKVSAVVILATRLDPLT